MKMKMRKKHYKHYFMIDKSFSEQASLNDGSSENPPMRHGKKSFMGQNGMKQKKKKPPFQKETSSISLPPEMRYKKKKKPPHHESPFPNETSSISLSLPPKMRYKKKKKPPMGQMGKHNMHH